MNKIFFSIGCIFWWIAGAGFILTATYSYASDGLQTSTLEHLKAENMITKDQLEQAESVYKDFYERGLLTLSDYYAVREWIQQQNDHAELKEDLAAIAMAKAHRTKAIADAIKSLPPGYKSDDHSVIFSVLKKLNIQKKSEFESTQEFQDRVDLAKRSGKVNFGRDWHFVMPLDEELITYDADNHQLAIKLEPTPLLDIDGYYAYTLSQKSKNLGKYVGSNAFGKKVTIDKSRIYLPSVAIKTDFIKGQQILVDIKSKFSQKQKQSIAVLIGGKLVEPFILESSILSAPTIDSPSETIFETPCVVIELSEFVVFDKLTGQILKTLDKNAFEESLSH
jgi:hypothetical protein